eukprot:180609_1
MSLCLKIKRTNGQTIETYADPDLTIYDLKAICWEELDAPPEQQTLLYKGVVCKDEDTLESIKITDNSSLIVLLKKPQNKPPKPATNNEQKTDDQSTNNDTNSVQNAMPRNPLSMQQSLMQNPELLQQMMNSPMMKQMFNNPDILQSIFNSSPQMQKLLEKNPELRHAMKDPAFMKQMMRAATDPKYRQELMQNQDRTLRNIESMPGGFNALSRMYNQVQNPMESALDDMHQQRFGKQHTKISEVDKSNGPTVQPLGNPWAPQQNNNNNGNGNGMLNMGNMGNMMRMMMNNNNNNGNARQMYANQLSALRNMGFNDEQRNIEALIAAGGDINRAIQYLTNNTQ